ncbi:hypothetical protein BV898_12166 [Hypsibius exemplaris]|uniref:Major facilitator superfamily (MFS) profile domain-containing protein n=1 Tax=Hypsibius exemplaris TaxID=2072580 RepID=A0A1W0WER7_HYPEX|nr:hypothetical protein BV898_12166 [Hypsibius exemplaris]
MKATTNWVTGAKRFLYWHYHDTHFARTEKQLAQEKWLIPKLVPFNRWYLMPASFLIETCCGSIYAWSGYNLPIEAKLYGLNGGIDRAIVVNVFYVAVCVFAITAAILGPWLERIGPLKSEQLAATLFFVGNLLTALGAYCNSLTCIYIGYGIFSGAGIGIGSVAPIGPLQTWFPESRGSAAGLALCGYGAGSIVASYVQAGKVTFQI